MPRRDFIKLTGASAAALLTSRLPIIAGPFEAADFEKLIPADKKLRPGWIKSLFERGSRTTYRGAELEKIGMPIGGICAGMLYLGGDGKLWQWDIFNRIYDAGSTGPHYAKPLKPASPLEQGFALRLTTGARTQVRALDRTGWSDITFTGEYPMGFVEYRDPEVPVTVSLEAFSPFIPLNADDSALPVTVMRFTVKNTGKPKVEATLAGWLENAVGLHTGRAGEMLRRNRIDRRVGFTLLECSAEPLLHETRSEKRPEILFEDFEKASYEGWTVDGTAFGPGPIEASKMPAYQGKVGAKGDRLVNSHNTRNGEDVAKGDSHVGALTSKPFPIERDFINFLIGGGPHEGKTCVNLIVDEKVVLSAAGPQANKLRPHCFAVRPWAGKTGRLQIVDHEKGAWGNIGVDEIVFSDEPISGSPVRERPDFGSMGLVLLDSRSDEFALTSLLEGVKAKTVFASTVLKKENEESKPLSEQLCGALGRKFSLATGESATVTFIVTWHFPNLHLGGLANFDGRWYGKKFADTLEVTEYVAANFSRLHGETKLWHETWYQSTLPYWFLDRTFLNTSILASSTCYWLGNGRFYAWEGVGCCAGTCAHVWHYAQAVGRLFPALERSLRETVDYGIGFESSTGRIRFRAEQNNQWAVDAQAGTILRTLREHQMSADSRFLRRLWPRVKQSLEFLMSKDADDDGLIDGPQHNTLDADWFGKVAWLNGLYLAALRAGEEMALESGDNPFAARCRQVFEKGRRNLDETLFNGEYYIQLAEPAHAHTVGSYDGCEIDQVMGQSWAWQVALGRLHDESKIKTALQSLWKYNFTPDVGPYRKAYKPGRWYAMAGEGGLVMCTWPKGESSRVNTGFDYYFNECMTGFEYQVAGHFIAEGMVMEGLAVTRTIHDRYHPTHRNPWNEIECGDHYARAMASYGVFLAACGYEYHGPKGHLGFVPRVSPKDFRAAFTSADGWGSLAQKAEGGRQKIELAVKWGHLRLRTLSFELVGNIAGDELKISANGRPLSARFSSDGKRVEITLESEAEIRAGQTLEVVLS